MSQQRTRDWVVTKLFVPQPSATQRAASAGRLRRRGESVLVDAEHVAGLHWTPRPERRQPARRPTRSSKAADLAEVIHDLSPKRRLEVAAALDDDKLADVLEELPEDDQVEILTQLANERAADVLEAMEPDDAADLLSELPAETAEHLLQLMEPEEAAPLRRLLTYDEDTAGGLMTSEPVILGPDATHRRGAGRRPAGRDRPRAGRQRVRLPPAAGDADRPLPRSGAHPADAPRAAARPRRRHHRQGHRAARPGHHARCADPVPGDLQPGQRAHRGRGRPPARRRHRGRRPGPHAPRGLARGRTTRARRAAPRTPERVAWPARRCAVARERRRTRRSPGWTSRERCAAP